MSNQYTISVEWDSEDEIYVARVAEYPSLAAHGDTEEEAREELQFVLSVVVEETLRDE